MPGSRFDVRAGSAEALTAAFALFLHDLRGSLGAATGCLRLAHTADGGPMIANAAQALRAISRLTQHAATWLDTLDENETPREWVPGAVVVTAVARAIGVPDTVPASLDPALGLALSSVDGVAAAAAAIVHVTAGAEPVQGIVTIEPLDGELVIACGTPDDRDSLLRSPRRPFPGRDGGFSLFAAHQVIAAHGGAVWALDPPLRAVAVALPLERA